MSNREPIVTVAMCLYNGLPYIDETLRSVFGQTCQDFEIVIVDDGSTDGSADFIERQFPDARIRIVRQKNQTLRVARPVAVAHARGRFIAFVDHDDVWLAEKLERQLAVACSSPEIGLVFSDCYIIDASGRTVGRLSDQYELGAFDLTGTQAHLELLRRGCFIAYPTALARTAAVRAVGGFNRTYQYVSDYDLWLRLARRFELKCLNEPLAKYRVHERQFTQQHSDITLAEHTALLRPVVLSSSYPLDVRTSISHNLFGQHRVACGLLLRQRRLREALRAAWGGLRYPIPLRDYCHHLLVTSPVGPAARWVLARIQGAHGRWQRWSRGRKAQSRMTDAAQVEPVTIWIDGSPLGGAQTGYFSLVSELIRRLARHQSPRCHLHIVAAPAGRAALLERLGADGSGVQFHRLGWRALHWSHVYQVLFGWRAHLLLGLVSVALLAFAIAAHNPLAISGTGLAILGQITVLLDGLAAEAAGASGRPRLSYASRLVRFLWRRLPAPRGRAGRPNTIEVLFWRGRFRWRDSHRIAILQDMTPRSHPQLHTEANISEFEEFLGYVQRHARTVVTVSEHSRRDIVHQTTVCPESVRVMTMPVHPQYVDPLFDDGVVASHGLAGPYVLCVATIEPRKNLRRLVRAFERLRDEPEARGVSLVLVGPQGWDEGFRDFLLTTDADARVRVLGVVPLEHLPSLYHSAAAVVYPSVYEGFGLPVLEAMCSEAVVLASRSSSLPEVLGQDGLLFDPRDTADIQRALLHALRLSPAEAARYRSRCRQRADAHLQRLAKESPLPGLASPAATELA